MKVCRGNSRTVVCLGGLAFKFPRYSNLWKIIKYAVILGCKWQWKSLRNNTAQGMIYVLNGLMANLSEFAIYLYSESPVLAPVYFSIGFFSVQKYMGGVEPTWKELNEVWSKLPEKARTQMQWVNLHNWESHSFRKTLQGMVMIDYGDTILSGNMSLSNYLVRWEHELRKVMQLPNTTAEEE